MNTKSYLVQYREVRLGVQQPRYNSSGFSGKINEKSMKSTNEAPMKNLCKTYERMRESKVDHTDREALLLAKAQLFFPVHLSLQHTLAVDQILQIHLGSTSKLSEQSSSSAIKLFTITQAIHFAL